MHLRHAHIPSPHHIDLDESPRRICKSVCGLCDHPPCIPTASLCRNPSPVTMDASTNRPRVRFAARVTPAPQPTSLIVAGYCESLPGSPSTSMMVDRYSAPIPGSPPASEIVGGYYQSSPGSPPAPLIIGGYCESIPGSPPTSQLVGGTGESIPGPHPVSLMFGSYRAPIRGSPAPSLFVGGTSESIHDSPSAPLLIGGSIQSSPRSPPPSRITGGYLAAPLLTGRYIQHIPGSPPASLLGGPSPSPSLTRRRTNPPLTISIPRPPRPASTDLSLRTGQPNLTAVPHTPRPPLRTPFPQLSLPSPYPPASFPSYHATLRIPIAPSPPVILNPSNFDYFSPSPSIHTPANYRYKHPPRPDASSPHRRLLPSPSLTFSRQPVAARSDTAVPGLLTLGFRAGGSSSRSSSSSPPVPPPRRLRLQTRTRAVPDERDHRWECCNCGAINTRWEFLCSACRVHGRGAGRERCCLIRGEEGWAGDGGGSEESGEGETGRWEGWGGVGGRRVGGL